MTSGPAARVYGINDMSIFANRPSSTADVYIAEIDTVHAGKTLELTVFDPGESNANAFLRIRDPLGNIPTCSWEAFVDMIGAVIRTGSGSCDIQTTFGGDANPTPFNGYWIRMAIAMPDAGTYQCSTDPNLGCFWRAEYQFTSGNDVRDRTTWAARVIGSPIHLVIGDSDGS